jgi:DNA-3-methyladenine glycosylase
VTGGPDGRPPPDRSAAQATVSRTLLEGDTLVAARALLGARLVRDPGRLGGEPRSGRIVEVEAYIGREDRASHARMGPTPRNQAMFGLAGCAYVYLVYGMHHCVNVVTETPGRPAAVLIRAVEPVGGLSGMRAAREAVRPGARRVADARLAAGPGLVGLAFGLDRSMTGVDLCDPASPLRLEVAPADETPPEVVSSQRIGIAYAGEPWTSLPWRFVAIGSPSLSRQA